MKKKIIYFGAPSIGEREVSEVVKILRSGWIGTGRKAKEFEDEIRRFTCAKYAVSLSSCSAALHLGLLALGIGRGSDVMTTPLTFPATINSIIHAGATPVFADIDRDTFNISPEKIEETISRNYSEEGSSLVNKRTKNVLRAVLAVHFAGRPCDMNAIMKTAKKYGLYVVEDAAHALEARHDGRSAGTIGDIGCFSFYPNKNITAIRGGMLVTDNKNIAKDVRLRRFHGIDSEPLKRARDISVYRHLKAGFEYNMADVEAALGLCQLKKTGIFLRRRAFLWKLYDENFKGLPVMLPAPVPEGQVHSRHLYTLIIDKKRCGITRDGFRKMLKHKGIGTSVHYPSIHLEPMFKNGDSALFPDKTAAGPVLTLPNAEYVSGSIVSLPLYPGLSDSDAARVIREVRSCFGPGRPGHRARPTV